MRKLLLPIIAIVLVLSSCTDDLTSLNDDPKGAATVPGENLFSNAQANLGWWINTTNYNTNSMRYMAQYWAATTYADESQYNFSGRAIPSNIFSDIYKDVLRDTKEASKLIEEDEFIKAPVKQNQQAIIEIVNVLAYYELVTIFGDVPYSEALDSENPQPKFDDAAGIYTDLISRLNKAMSDLDPSAASFGVSDIYYQGDVNAWIRFANSLKMRIAITIADAMPGPAKTAFEAAASGDYIDENAENATIQFQTGNHQNPVWSALVNSGRNDFVAANTIVDMMNNINDPRRAEHWTQVDTTNDGVGDGWIGGIYGESNGYSDYSHMTGEILNENFEGMLLAADEVEFMFAEAAERGWNVSGTAATHYNNAITLDMEYWGLDDSGNAITNYLAQPEVAYATAPDGSGTATWREKIGTQKWLGLYNQGMQGWTVWRRLDAPTFNGIASIGITESDIPTRFTYPVDEQNLNNKNYKAASQAIGGDKKTTKLFWDVN